MFWLKYIIHFQTFYSNVDSIGDTIMGKDKYFKRKWIRSELLYITIKRSVQPVDGTKSQLKL